MSEQLRLFETPAIPGSELCVRSLLELFEVEPNLSNALERSSSVVGDVAFEADFDVDDDLVWVARQSRRWPCGHCGGMPLSRSGLEDDPFLGADPCLGWLSDVAHACCGHGREHKAYVVVAPGCYPSQGIELLSEATTLHGEDALAYFRSRDVGPSAERATA